MSNNSNSNPTVESYKLIFESSLDAILLTHPDGTIFYANSSAEELYGYTQQEICDLGRSGIADTNDPNLQVILDEMARLDRSKGELTLIKKDGSKFPAEVSTSIFKDENGNINTFMTIRDISQCKRNEKQAKELLESEQQLVEELQASNEELQSVTEELHVSNEELQHQREGLVKVNQALLESEERKDRSQEIAHLGSWELDILKNKLFWSDEVYRIFGLKPQEFDATYEAFLKAIHPDDREAVDEAYTSSLHEGVDTYEIEHRVVRRSTGEIRIVHEKCEHLRDSSGRIVRSLGMVHDITERKKVEESLNQSQKLLQDIINGFPSPIFVKDIEGRFLTVNNKFEELLGVKNKELKGKTDYDIITKELAEYYRANDQKVLEEGKAISIEEEADLIDGHHTFIANKFPIYDNNSQAYGIGSVSTDITELKKTEEILKESEERLRLAQSLGNVGIWDWNTITDELHFTPELELLYGLIPGTIKTYQDWRQLTHPDDIEKIEAERDEKIANHEAFDLQFRILHKSGQIHWLSAKGGAIYNDEGDILRVLGINSDITDRINREEELKIFMNELERSNKELEQFAYITSHDLREPLRMIISFLQLLERRYKDQLDEDANEFIGFAVDGAKRLDAMTNDLLQYSKITSEKREVKPVNFENVMEHALTNLKVPIEENNAIITHDPLPTINGDEQLKVQLFQNLIGNAIKYRSQETPKIHISATKEKNQYLFSINDNGIGISQEHLKKIFTIFQRLHTQEQYEGTGIGLAIAQKIVHQRGGQIWAESELGEGSTFYFTIPY
ncbi:PAS domain-containing sensor histidine kinase [Methanobacterium spitsbergense]|uniref:histidine kinase n=1 Tax=Methanobacterium spitsbergense TaxID=2874285 RepID=A0A8T5URC5_9EURY|nr:PAS domain-containing sensor histidine kinase [Methanobacterium spitsbergense]MBZ2164516.1 PAS domain S-box protein [Methanobacterium spitsbergense]